jgi:signal transduction histidine kinase
VVRHWVALHGGTVRIESATGRGTQVRVNLPGQRAAGAVGEHS